MIDNISRYKTFVATAESTSVSEAARKLFVSQPAVSAEIAALESALSVTSNSGYSLVQQSIVTSSPLCFDLNLSAKLTGSNTLSIMFSEVLVSDTMLEDVD